MMVFPPHVAALLALLGDILLWACWLYMVWESFFSRPPIERELTKTVWVCENGHELGPSQPPPGYICSKCLAEGRIVRHLAEIFVCECGHEMSTQPQKGEKCPQCGRVFSGESTSRGVSERWNPRPPLPPQPIEINVDTLLAVPEVREQIRRSSEVIDHGGSELLRKGLERAVEQTVDRRRKELEWYLPIVLAVGLLPLILWILSYSVAFDLQEVLDRTKEAGLILLRVAVATTILFVVLYLAMVGLQSKLRHGFAPDPELQAKLTPLILGIAATGAILLLSWLAGRALDTYDVFLNIALNILGTAAYTIFYSWISWLTLDSRAKKVLTPHTRQ